MTLRLLSNGIRALVTLGAIAGTWVAQAQTPADWPTLKGNNARTGRNAAPADNGSGLTQRSWLYPYTANDTTTITLDNTAFAATPDGTWPAGFPGGTTYSATAFGVVNEPTPSRAAWIEPADTTKEAQGVFLQQRNANATATTPANLLYRAPTYLYTRCTPSAKGQLDPRVPADPTKLVTWTWEFDPPAGPRSYSLYVWLPVGSTDISATGSTTPNRVFPQEFYVYEIEYGQGPDGKPYKEYDVVDSYAAGVGFVRLGNGGRTTSRTYQYDGTHPIKVRLYNTVPRDPVTGQLLIYDDRSFDRNAATEQTDSNKFVVYADAAQAKPTIGSYVASPSSAYFRDATGVPLVEPVGDPDVDNVGTFSYQFCVTAALNQLTSGASGSSFQNLVKGVVTCWQPNPKKWTVPRTGLANEGTPSFLWQYSPLDNSEFALAVDNTSASSTAGWVVDTANPIHQGTNYLSTAIVTTAATQTASYQPTLDDDSYQVFAFFPGNGGGETFGKTVEYDVYEGATLAYTGTVDESVSGWVALGSRRYNSSGSSLKVVLTNHGGAGDAGLLATADAVRFIGAANLGINSTPVHATITLTGAGTKQVVIVADEAGRIHCLDMKGKGDGTTTEYWSYPSTPDQTDPNWADPNLSEGIDGTITTTPPRNSVPVALMPQRFDLSTAIVTNVNGTDYLYIGANNGRVYCIDMSGRGDYNATSNKVGSAKRVWTYPDDYPKVPAASHGVGSFRGSLVYANIAGLGGIGPTVYVPASEGRIYALDALGNATSRTTTVKWAYPAINKPTLPSIVSTPALEFGNLYFGTMHNSRTEGPGNFIAISANTGKLIWQFDGTAAGTVAVPEFVDDFVTGPATASKIDLDKVTSPYATSTVNSVYALNQNNYFYGFNAATGKLLTALDGRPFRTKELGAVSDGNLGFTVVTTYDNTGALRDFPIVTIPTTSSFLYGMFARADDFNRNFSDVTVAANPLDTFTSYSAWGHQFSGSEVNTPAFSNRRMFVTDSDGYFYQLDRNLQGFGSGFGPTDLDQEVDSLNNPTGAIYREAKVKLLSRAGYQSLRVPQTVPYGTILNNDGSIANPSYFQNYTGTLAFEWGETAYILVHDFPYVNQDSKGNYISPPIVEVTISVDGKVVRDQPATALLFQEPPNAPSFNAPNDAYRKNGYAIISFTFQGGGPNSVPPGDGEIGVRIRGANNQGITQVFLPDPRPNSGSRVPFKMLNPLGLAVLDPYVAGTSLNPAVHSIGVSVNRSDIQNQVNGSPDVSNPAGEIFSRLLSSAGFANHAETATSQVYIYDRSLMSLIRPAGHGLDIVRVDRSNLGFQGGTAGLVSPINNTLYPGFEDTPINFPNTSLDYPDIGQEQIRFTKDPNGNAENPLLTNVSLLPPLNAAGQPLTEDDDPSLRQIQPTQLQINVDVPKYQPPVNTANVPVLDVDNYLYQHNDSKGNLLPQGYFGRARVFVDSINNGQLDLASKEAYRSFELSLGVVPDRKIHITTPNTDLGSLAAGTGYEPLTPRDAAQVDLRSSPFSPWNGVWGSGNGGAYRDLTVVNDGNVNALNVRIAKSTSFTTNANGTINSLNFQLPWQLVPTANDPLAWINGTFDLSSNLDPWFTPNNPYQSSINEVLLQKPRVTDRVPSQLNVNPSPRTNPNTGTVGTETLFDTSLFPQGNPKVAVSVPLGFPVGAYTSRIVAIDESPLGNGNPNSNLIWEPITNTNAVETYTDPAMELNFTVRESRLTNTSTPKTAPMADPELVARTDGQPARFTYTNATPAAMRDSFGGLVVAWASNRPATQQITPAADRPRGNDPYRIYLSSLATGATFGSNSVSYPADPYGRPQSSPLQDLNYWIPSSTAAASPQWFNPATPNGFPTSSLFPNDVVAGTERYGSPAFPQRGEVDPLNPTSRYANTYMAFVGEAQRLTGSGRISASEVFLTSVATDSKAKITIGTPVVTLDDAQTTKSRPSVMQAGQGSQQTVLVGYGVTSAGQSGIHLSRFDGTNFGVPVALDFGAGFDSVTQPSLSARTYTGALPTTVPSDGSDWITPQVVDLSFSGKLRGRPSAEIFMGRLRLNVPTAPDAQHPPIDPTRYNGSQLQLVDANNFSLETTGARSPFAFMPIQYFERLISDGNGQYRSRGVAWDRSIPVQLFQFGVGQPATGTDLLIAGTQVLDRQSGLITYDTRLGGKATFDPGLGTVRFSTAVPNPNLELRLTYRPAFLRVSSGSAAGYTNPTGMFDDHYVSDFYVDAAGNPQYLYWQRAAGGPLQPSDQAKNDRWIFTYGKGATGGGQTASPYFSTMRLGVRLPSRIFTFQGGLLSGNYNGTAITAPVVTGATGPYQIDPSNGRIYVSRQDEDRVLTISYWGVNETDKTPVQFTGYQTAVSMVAEKAEGAILIDEAVNESNLASFLDPFSYASTNTVRSERPPLVWLFYTSTRAGSPDVFFQTIAPHLAPTVK